MLDLNDFRLFVEVVDRGGFSAAGRALQRPISTISYRIAQLERELGLPLLARTSRTVAMTQAGEEFYGLAASMLERANEAEMVMRGHCTEPAGNVHYTVGILVAQFALPGILPSFLARYPKVKLIQHTVDAQVDIVTGRYDLAIRAHAGPLPDSQLIQRPLADVPWYLYASPDYVRRIGQINSPEELENHETLFLKRQNADPVWRMRSESDKSRLAVVHPHPRMLGACAVTLKQAAEAGLGIVALPACVCREEVRLGQLVRVLPDWIAAVSTITALMPHRRMSAGTRAFIDHIAAAFPSQCAMVPAATL